MNVFEKVTRYCYIAMRNIKESIGRRLFIHQRQRNGEKINDSEYVVLDMKTRIRLAVFPYSVSSESIDNGLREIPSQLPLFGCASDSSRSLLVLTATLPFGLHVFRVIKVGSLINCSMDQKQLLMITLIRKFDGNRAELVKITGFSFGYKLDTYDYLKDLT